MADEARTSNQEEGAAPAAPSVPAPSASSGLELRALTKIFAGGVVAVDDVNLTIEHGEYVVLLGPSGCGKTTTLRMIGGHETPTSGEILLDGENLPGLPPDKRPTTTVFQHFALFPHRSVLENVEFGLKMHGSRRKSGAGAPWRRSRWSASRSWPIASRGRSRAGSSSASRSRACS